MNQLALLRPAARRSVFVNPAPLTVCHDDAARRSEAPDAHETQQQQSAAATRRRRRTRSKNCASVRKGQLQQRRQQRDALARDTSCTSTSISSVTATGDGIGGVEPTRDLAYMRRQLAQIDQRLTLLESVALVSRQNAQAATVQLMAKYHEFTCHGYTMRDEDSTRFLQSFFADDVRCSDFTGLSVFRQQWEHISRCHASIRVATQCLDVLPAETLDTRSTSRFSDDVFVVRSVGTTTLRISRQTIECVFPHVLADEPLVQWLIGREYVVAYTLVVHVNSEGKIFQLESHVDLTSALLGLLKDPLVTLKLVEASAMTRAGNLLLQSEVRESQNTIENGFL